MNSESAPRNAVVVGVDGSPTSNLALDFAVEEATRNGLPLHIFHGFPCGYPSTRIGMGYALADLSDLAVGVRKDAIERARAANPTLSITWEQPQFSPAVALVHASETANTVVVGARGMSAVRGLLLGSVSVQVASHAHCPVVVVHERRPPSDAKDPVVVGVDGSPSSMNAVAYAYEQAASRGVGLTAVHACWLEHVEGASASAIWTGDWQQFAEEELALVTESLASWQEKYPDVTVTRHSIRGLPLESLVEESENACLVVVGSRGRGGFAGLVLGSVSQGVMHRSHCPVAVVRGPKEVRAEREDTERAHHLLPVPLVFEPT